MAQSDNIRNQRLQKLAELQGTGRRALCQRLCPHPHHRPDPGGVRGPGRRRAGGLEPDLPPGRPPHAPAGVRQGHLLPLPGRHQPRPGLRPETGAGAGGLRPVQAPGPGRHRGVYRHAVSHQNRGAHPGGDRLSFSSPSRSCPCRKSSTASPTWRPATASATWT